MSQTVPGKPFDRPSRRAIQLLQEKWVLNIVCALLDGPRGFNELGREAGGCNPSTLTQRLTKLEQLGLVCKRCEPDCSRATYGLTAAGEGLSDVLEAIEAWASHHLAEEAPARREAAPRLDGLRIDLDRSALRRPSAASGRARVARTLAGSNGAAGAEEGAGEAASASASASGEGPSPTP